MIVLSEIRVPRARLSRSLKVIGTGADRSGTYDFMLVVHSRYESIPYRFRDKRRFRSKIEIFPTQCIKRPRWAGAPAGFQARVGKIRREAPKKFFPFAHPGFQFAHPAIRNGCPPCPPYRGGFKGKGLVGHLSSSHRPSKY